LITNPSLIEFFDAAKQKKFSAGELIMTGEDPSGVVMVMKGFVDVYSISDEGDRYVHIIYKSDEIFPLIWVFRGIRRRVFYEAMTDVVVAEAPKEQLVKLLKSRTEASFDVMSQLAEQFYIFADRLDNLEYKSAYERVAYRLVFLASRFGEQSGGSVIIKAPLTHELIGQSINLARETVSRAIEKLEKAGLIGRKDNFIVIKDIEKLGREFSEPITLDLWGLSRGDR
jgi:CRP/FNR family transcriptional regulator